MEYVLRFLVVVAIVYVAYTLVSPLFMPVKASRLEKSRDGKLGFDDYETGRKMLDSMFR